MAEPLGEGTDGVPVYLKDIWPSNQEIRETVEQALTPEMFRNRYANVFEGPEEWRAVKTASGLIYDWEPDSTYVRFPPFFEGMKAEPEIARRCDRRAPARHPGRFRGPPTTSRRPAPSRRKARPGNTCWSIRCARPEFNSYGSRRGNHEVMMRGTFANIRIRNEMVPGIEGGMTRHLPGGEVMPILRGGDGATRPRGVPLVIIAGKEYGTGSSRDWAAKGTRLLGVKAVIVESFERIHRSNLVGMGVLPLQFTGGATRASLNLTSEELIRHHGRGRRPKAAHGPRLHDPPARTARVGRSPCFAASIPPTRWTTTATAASCTMSCAS